jgi:hypothetical protein
VRTFLILPLLPNRLWSPPKGGTDSNCEDDHSLLSRAKRKNA